MACRNSVDGILVTKTATGGVPARAVLYYKIAVVNPQSGLKGDLESQ